MAVGQGRRILCGPAAALVFLLAAHGSSARTLAEIRKHGVLRASFLGVLPEFFSEETGAPPGFDRELLERFAREQKLRLEVVPTHGADEALQAVEKDRADVVAGGVVETRERLARLRFTSAILSTRHVALTRGPSGPIQTMAELRGATVGTIPGTSWAEVIAEAGVPPEKVIGFKDLPALREGLRQGRVSAIVLSLAAALSEERRDPALHLGLLLGPPEPVGWGVAKSDAELADALDRFIRSLRGTREWTDLLVKYWGPEGPKYWR